MHVRRNRLTARPPRSGFTLIELLVVISIIAVLMALLLPGIQNARKSARRLQCESQMRNTAVAMHTYADAHNGDLPYLLTDLNDPNADRMNFGTLASPVPAGVPWSVQLLPHLEQQELFDRLTTNDPPAGGPNSIIQLRQIPLQILTCPEDGSQGVGGHMTQVVNAGLTTRTHWLAAEMGTALNQFHTIAGGGVYLAYDWSFNGYGGVFPVGVPDQEITRATGAFFQQAASGGYRQKIDGFPDGSSHTAVLSENLHANTWSGGTGLNQPNLNGIAYMLAFEDTGTATDIASNQSSNLGLGPDDPGAKSQAAAYLFMGLGIDNDPVLGRSTINGNVDNASVNGAPRPSSNHNGVINVFFADGHGLSVSENIDIVVWWNLQTPNGQRHGENIQGDF